MGSSDAGGEAIAKLACSLTENHMPKKIPVEKAAQKIGSSPKKKPVTKRPARTKAPLPKAAEHRLAENALKLLDQASDVLRAGINQGASASLKSRMAAKKKASTLVSRASKDLSKAIETGGSTLQGLIGKF